MRYLGEAGRLRLYDRESSTMTATLPDLKPLAGLDSDLRRSLLAQVRDLWTHESATLEGNTPTLGETKFVIEEGLTVSGKPLSDHQEVFSHARH
jgi:Fic family protein